MPDFASSLQTRRCPGCRSYFPATADYFYLYPSSGRLGRCTTCHRAQMNEYAARRRNGGTRRLRRGAGVSEEVLTGADRRFGVEIEFIGSREDVCREIRNLGIECNVEGYNHRIRSGWKVITDASVSRGGELVSPPMSGDDGREQIRLVCQAMRAAGASVNSSTGLHVHHEVRDMPVRAFGRLFRFWFNSQDVIDTLVSRSRRNSSYAGRLEEREVRTVESLADSSYSTVSNACRWTRYKSLNIECYPRYGTVEIRQHQGTLNANKILGWIEFGQACITFALSEVEMMATDTFDTTIAMLILAGGMTVETADFLRRRTVALADGPVEPENEARENREAGVLA